ncbi:MULTISPECIES: glycosyltransferase [Cyanophyceae]|uniref:Glycosyltransferase n=1 Tax=Leptolyngbya subtilissima DQ-A4 TaxID=2933933 RepID=A0ABV0JYR3_9CYAN|nr:glycosyltransferase [Nodosilinea sp. FACHB-141]MBD2112303.1 glycosyltransferase [Nodosilinea sp. FACHB-141]
MRYLNLGCGNHFHPDWVNIDFQSTGTDVITHDLRKPIPFADNTFDAVYHSHLLEHFSRSEAKPFLQECLRVLRPGGVLRIVVPDLEQIAREYLRILEETENGFEKTAHDYDWILLEMYDQAVRHQPGGDMAKYLSKNQIPNEDYVIKRFGYEGQTLIENLKGKNLEDSQNQAISENTNEAALAIGHFRLGGEVHQWMYDGYSLRRLLRESGFNDVDVYDPSESQIPNFSNYYLDVLENGQVRKPDSLFVEASKPNDVVDSWTFGTENSQEILKTIQIVTYDIQGGAARSAYRLHQGLRLIGQDSLMLTRYRKSEDQFVCSASDLSLASVLPDEYSLYAEIQLNYIDNNRTDLSNTLFSYPYPAIDLANVEQVKQADILNLHWVAWFQSAKTIASLLALGKPIVWTLHDMAAFTGGCHYSARCDQYQADCSECPQLKADKYNLPALILEDKLQHLLPYSNLTIVTPSKWLAECARKSSLFRNNRIEVIPYGLDIEVFKPIPKEIAKRHLGLPKDSVVLLFGADSNGEKRKGFELLLEALCQCFENSLVQQKLQEGQIRILNFGHGCSSLDSLGFPITSLGHITSDEELSYIYSASNVLLLPSLEDNLPNLMLESMSCGTPVFAFSTGGMKSFIKDKKTGVLVSPEDILGFSEAILDILLDPEKYLWMGSKARSEIEENNSLKHQANLYTDLYLDLLNNYQKSDVHKKQESERSIYSERSGLRDVAIESGRIALLKERQLTHDLRQEVIDAQINLQQAKETFQQTQIDLQQTQADLQQTQADLQQTQADLQQTQADLQQTQAAILNMEMSKFWQIRKIWILVKTSIHEKFFKSD